MLSEQLKWKNSWIFSFNYKNRKFELPNTGSS
jgi:hypothetical protein